MIWETSSVGILPSQRQQHVARIRKMTIANCRGFMIGAGEIMAKELLQTSIILLRSLIDRGEVKTYTHFTCKTTIWLKSACARFRPSNQAAAAPPKLWKRRTQREVHSQQNV
jgi:hypothetical protein